MTGNACHRCPLAHNGINGRYCEALKRYVEHDKVPPCTPGNKRK